MNAVDNGVQGMDELQWLASRLTEGNVSAKLPHRAARFDSPHYISPREMMLLKTYAGLHKNSYLVQTAQRFFRQGEPAAN